MTHDFEHKPVKTLLVDFDDVIHDMSDGWQDGKIYGMEIKDATKSIQKLQRFGYEIVVFTAREDVDEVREWLIKQLSLDLEVTNQKRPCLAIIDDRAVRFTSWADVMRYFI